jgi:hypothetical protein
MAYSYRGGSPSLRTFVPPAGIADPMERAVDRKPDAFFPRLPIRFPDTPFP